jgi:two-component system, OmpR family, sensor kinase
VTRRRSSLALRISLLGVAIAVITALVAGGLAFGLVRQLNDRNARQLLSRLADAAQTLANAPPNPTAGEIRARQLLRTLKIQFGTVDGTGQVVTSSAIVRNALTRPEIGELLAGSSLSSRRTVDGQTVLVEGRPTNSGAIVLVQRRADAVAVGDAALRRLLVALAIAVGIAIVLGLVVAWRLARPLKRTAAAAHALRSGRRDVTLNPQGPDEVREVADALNSLASGLAQSEARQRQFLMSVSHDLRTPLTAINGYAESLADGVVPPDQTARVGSIMLGESHRLSRLVGDLLDLARLDAREFRIDLSVVDVGGVVDSAAEVWSGRCRAEGVAFRVERPPTPVPAYTDPNRLRQVLDGLLENALRVTPAAAPIVLAARFESTGGGVAHVVAEVRDGGPGLSDDDLAVAFDRSVLYERYRGLRSVGTGLGLAIVHGLVERIGGTIEAGHAPEGGARFTVRMPVGRDSA